MKIDFRKIEGKDVDDKKIIIDLSKTLGNTMYRTSLTDEEMRLGKEIYDKGSIEVNKARALSIKRYVNNGNFYAFVKIAVNPILDKIIREDKGLESTKGNK
jgi:hypothetical protein